MAEYQATSISSLRFELTQSDHLIGKLSYQSWFKFDALIEMASNVNYQVEPKGFWGTTIEIKDHDSLLLKFQMNWSGEIVIQTYSNGVEKGYVFKHRGFFKESYVLENQEGIELLVMKPSLKWSKMSYEFQIVTTNDFESFSDKELLLMTSLHCANYYVSMVSSYQ